MRVFVQSFQNKYQRLAWFFIAYLFSMLEKWTFIRRKTSNFGWKFNKNGLCLPSSWIFVFIGHFKHVSSTLASYSHFYLHSRFLWTWKKIETLTLVQLFAIHGVFCVNSSQKSQIQQTWQNDCHFPTWNHSFVCAQDVDAFQQRSSTGNYIDNDGARNCLLCEKYLPVLCNIWIAWRFSLGNGVGVATSAPKLMHFYKQFMLFLKFRIWGCHCTAIFGHFYSETYLTLCERAANQNSWQEHGSSFCNKPRILLVCFLKC